MQDSDREESSQAPLEVSDHEAPLWVRRLTTNYRGFLSVFKPLAGPYSLGLMTHECEFCLALHFVEEAVAPNAGRLLFQNCCLQGRVRLETLKGVPPYLQSLFESQSANGQHFR